MTHRLGSEQGFSLLGVILAGLCLALCILVYLQSLSFASLVQDESVRKKRALLKAVQKIEQIKVERDFADNISIEEEKGNFTVFTTVEAFLPRVFRLTVTVTDNRNRELVSIEALARE